MKDSTAVNLWKNLISLILAFFCASVATAQYREESSALEQIYESRARTALNTIMRPNEYSIVVSVEISHDPKQLLDVENEVDKMSLPGISGMSLPENMNVSNKLHELRNKISIHVTLDESVSKEKEAAAKMLTSMKLHIDESAGDTITTGRALLIPKEIVPPPADLLPELSWRMWALVIIVSLVALGLFFTMALRKPKNADANQEPHKDLAKDKEENPKDVAAALAEEKMAEQESAAFKPDESETQAIEIYEKKKALLALATKYPEAAAKAIEEEFEKGNRTEVLLTFETMEWEVAKSLFRGLSHRTWVRLGAEMAARTQKAPLSDYLQAIEVCHRSVVAKYLELSEGDVENPFAFLVKLVPDDIQRLLVGQSPTDIASICVFLDASQKKTILEILPEDLQQATLLQITKLKEVPFEIVKKVVGVLKEKLQFMKDNPSVSFDGQKFLMQLLRELDVLSEKRFIENLAKENPAEMETLRRNYLQFADLAFISEDILSEAFGTIDMKVLTSSIYGADENIRFHCLSVLPEKRAKMVEKDLSYLKDMPLRETLSAQRVVLKSVNASLLLKGKIPGDFLQNKTPLMAVTEAA